MTIARRVVFFLAVGVFSAAVLIGYGVAWRGITTTTVEVIIPDRASLHRIAAILERRRVIDLPRLFTAAATFVGAEKKLQAGRYIIPAGASILAVLDMIRRGDQVPYRLTVPEGWTVADVVARIDAIPSFSGTIKSLPEEGSLLPDTYFYPFGYDRSRMVRDMTVAMDKALRRAWSDRDPGLPLANAHEALILASIVEKETALAQERPIIAAVFLNRLRRGMRLQSDPTVLYTLQRSGHGTPARLGRADLKAPGPWNTYLHEGLPMTPICLPGIDAVRAVLHPASVEYLYFVADGLGGHVFSRTLRDHNRHVRALRRARAARAAAP